MRIGTTAAGFRRTQGISLSSVFWDSFKIANRLVLEPHENKKPSNEQGCLRH